MLHVYVMQLGTYQTNCYVVWSDSSDTCVVIDPGYDPEKILSEAERMHKHIEAILLTHGHFDHVGAVEKLALQTGCPVYIHKADYELQIPMLFPLTGKALPQRVFLEDGQTVSLAGLEMKVLHTPGHTPGSVCFQIEDCLITGDTLFAGSIGRTDFPGGDYDTICASLARLKMLKGKYDIFPGHGDATTLDEEKRYNPYLKGNL